MPSFIVTAIKESKVELVVTADNEKAVWDRNYDIEEEIELDVYDVDIKTVEPNI